MMLSTKKSIRDQPVPHDVFNSLLAGFSFLKTISASHLGNTLNVFISILCNVHVVNFLTEPNFIQYFQNSYRKAVYLQSTIKILMGQ